MEISDETLMAYVDGELPSAEAKRIAEAIQADPALAAKVQRFRNVRHALKRAYDNVLSEPVPDRLRALLHDVEVREAPSPQESNVVAFDAPRPRRRFSAQALGALAACLIGGVLVGRLSAPEPMFVTQSGQLRAGAALTRVLETRLASASENANADLRVGVSFRAKSGEICRTFEGRAEGGVSGLACRDARAWSIRVATATPGQHGGYEQAGADPVVMNMVDALISGEPFDASQEQAARANHWR
ncbi:MAG TPA: NepR family anti-sigma factor [Caulobacterales bacterium]|nr:NepR family anti-sigma factor [Caulobacterales bacterium]